MEKLLILFTEKYLKQHNMTRTDLLKKLGLERFQATSCKWVGEGSLFSHGEIKNNNQKIDLVSTTFFKELHSSRKHINNENNFMKDDYDKVIYYSKVSIDEYIENNALLKDMGVKKAVLYMDFDDYIDKEEILTKSKRPPWHEYFINMLDDVASRSTCLRRKVGAIIVDKDHRVVSMGYNGVPKNMRHCEDVGCLRAKDNIPSGEKLEHCRALHAEQNAILYSKQDLTDCTIYISFSPCVTCAKMIVASKISRVIFRGDYPENQLALDILNEAEVQIYRR